MKNYMALSLNCGIYDIAKRNMGYLWSWGVVRRGGAGGSRGVTPAPWKKILKVGILWTILCYSTQTKKWLPLLYIYKPLTLRK